MLICFPQTPEIRPKDEFVRMIRKLRSQDLKGITSFIQQKPDGYVSSSLRENV
jgi:hypothetical protein